MRRVILLLFALMAGLGLAIGQERTVTGVVTDAADGSPLSLAGIQIKGTQNGTVTDNEGRFTLRVPGPEAVLLFRYTGYQDQEVTVGEQTTFNIKMVSANEEIDQVVVTAFGSQKKSSITGAISSVDEKKLEKLPGADAGKAMEGQIAGVQVSSSSGSPGAGTMIRIRGIGSINASSSPLIIVDGAPYNGSLNTINPADIASWNVLKDAASAALYGARGANGVILITTKNGRKGRTVVNYDGRFGVNMRGIPEYDVEKDPKEYYRLAWQGRRMSFYLGYDNFSWEKSGALASKFLLDPRRGLGGYHIFKDVDPEEYILPDGTINPKLNSAGYIFEDDNWNDWNDYLFKPRFRQEHNLSVSKGMDKTKIFFSLGYLDDHGYSLNSYFKRITTRVNITQEIYSWLEFSNKFQYSRSDVNYNAGGGAYVNPFLYTQMIPPIYSILKHDAHGKILKDIDGNAVYDDGNGFVDPDDSTRTVNQRVVLKNLNPAITQRFDKDNTIAHYLSNVASLTFTFPLNFTFQTNLSYNAEFNNYTYRQYAFGDAKAINGRLRRSRGSEQSLNFNQILDWNWSFLDNDALNLAIKLGHESYLMRFGAIRGQKTNLLFQEAMEIRYAAKFESLDSWSGGYRLEGYFAQASLDYMQRYYFSASFRMDGSSVFHPKHRWGAFWSLGASWRISQEEFFKPALPYVNNLKLRLSYGLQGNDYLNLPGGGGRSYTAYQDLFIVDTDGQFLNITNGYKGNEKITWEKNYNLSAALEFGVLNNMISGELEFFTRTTRDMLFNLPMPAATGFTSRPENVGDMRNTGVELTLNVNPVRMERVNLDINFNLTHYKNTVLRLPDQNRKEGIARGTQHLMEGHSVYEWYLIKYQGVNPNTGSPLYRYRKSNDPHDTIPTTWYVSEARGNQEYRTASRDFMGSSLPDVQGGFGFILDVYGVDLSAQFSYTIGGKVFDDTYAAMMDRAAVGNAYHKDMKDSWTPENPQAKYPAISWDDRTDESTTNRFLESASNLAFRSIMVGYTLPTEWTTKFYVQQLRLYFVCDNVWVFSARKGFDPRMYIFTGGGRYSYSPIRTISGGIQLKF